MLCVNPEWENFNFWMYEILRCKNLWALYLLSDFKTLSRFIVNITKAVFQKIQTPSSRLLHYKFQIAA